MTVLVTFPFDRRTKHLRILLLMRSGGPPPPHPARGPPPRPPRGQVGKAEVWLQLDQPVS
jgi:hypothetical protein